MSNVLFQISGSIAAYKSCSVISRLVQSGHAVQTVATRSALEFVGPATLEGLTGRPVFTDAFESGRKMDHIHLARWADLAVLAPATANTINRLATGLADDAVGALFLAWGQEKPYLIAPAMNVEMWNHPATQSSVKRLESWGVKVLPTEIGPQACGEVGEGRLITPERIYEEILQAGRIPS